MKKGLPEKFYQKRPQCSVPNQTQAKSHEQSLNFASRLKVVGAALFKSEKLDQLARQKSDETG